jgi:hypothetical protein
VLSDLLVYLNREKIPELFPEELFKLLEVAIVAKSCGGIPLAVGASIGKKIL